VNNRDKISPYWRFLGIIHNRHKERFKLSHKDDISNYGLLFLSNRPKRKDKICAAAINPKNNDKKATGARKIALVTGTS
jgi:hypothetical protein